VLATLRYRSWQWLWAVYLCAGTLTFQSRIVFDWRVLLALGVAQWALGAELIRAMRPRWFRTLSQVLFREQDWATPILWMGTLCSLLALVRATHAPKGELIAASLFIAGLAALITARVTIARLPYLRLFMSVVALGV